MNVKQIIATAILLVPVTAASLVAKPASAHEVSVKRIETQRVVVVHRPKYESFRYRRVFIPGHWEYNRFGHRYWVSGRYVFR
jgi:hypothetical protein